MTKDSYIHATKDGPAYKPGGPLVFAFHGTGGNEQQFLDFAAQAMPEARVISPRGDVSEMGAARFFRRTGEGRYDFEDLARRTAAMTAFIKAHIEANRPSAVIGMGYSNGANILASIMGKSPDLFGHAALMHPLVTWDMAAGDDLAELRVLITAGGRDPICPPDMTGKLADMLEARGAQVKSWWHPGGHEITEDEAGTVKVWLGEVSALLEGSADLPIHREDDGRKGRFFMRTASGHEAEMTYTWGKPGCIIIDHTEVPDVFRGQGAGVRLLQSLIAAARADGFVVVPLCPFAAAQFKRHPEFADVLDTDFSPV